jgi:hypothetical protein
MEVSGLLHNPATLPWGKNHQYPLDRRLGGLKYAYTVAPAILKARI